MVSSRSAKLLVTGALAGLLLAGCADGPGQAGSAAIVNGKAISLDSVQSQLNDFLSAPHSSSAQQQTTPAQAARQIVGLDVLDQVIAGAGAKFHVSVPPSVLSAEFAQVGNLDQVAQNSGYSKAELQQLITQYVFGVVYATKYLPTLQIGYDRVLVPDQKTAASLAQKIAADPADVRSIMESAAGGNAQALSSATESGGQILASDLQFQQDAQQGQSSPGDERVLPLLSAKANTVLAFQVDQGDWAVYYIHSVDNNGKADSQVQTLVGEAGVQEGGQAGLSMLSPYAQDLGIKISPRYGTWDPVDMAVVDPTGTPTYAYAPVRSQPSS